MKRSTLPFVFALVAIACHDSVGPSPAPSPIAASITAVSNVKLTGVAGISAPELPSVVVKDESGKPLAGAKVFFTITSGGGTVTQPDGTTNSAGWAAMSSWILGKKVGINTVQATTGNLPGVTFTVDGVAGPPATLEKLAGDFQSAEPRSSVPISPLVAVKDANGNPVAGVKVTFTVVGGESSLGGASEVMSDNEGTAAVGTWTLGDTGVYSLNASVPGLSPVFFTAIVVQPCGFVSLLPAADAVSAELVESDCAGDADRFADYYTVKVDTAGAYSFSETSNSFGTALTLRSISGLPIAENNDSSGSARNSTFKALLLPGIYVLKVSSSAPKAVGGYKISWSATEPPVTCEEIFIVPGVDVSSYMTESDCLEPATIFTRHYRMYLRAGVSVSVTEDSGYETGYLSLDNIAGDEVALGESEWPYGTSLLFTPQSSGYYLLKVGYGDSRTIGQFSFSVR